jgi:hypothetical protein
VAGQLWRLQRGTGYGIREGWVMLAGTRAGAVEDFWLTLTLLGVTMSQKLSVTQTAILLP